MILYVRVLETTFFFHIGFPVPHNVKCVLLAFANMHALVNLVVQFDTVIVYQYISRADSMVFTDKR